MPDDPNVVTDYIKTNFPDLYDPYEAYRVTRNGETFALSDEEIKFIDQSKTLGYNDEEINTFLDKRFANRGTVTEDTDFDMSTVIQNLASTEAPKPEDTSVGPDGITTENEINIEPIEEPVQETVTDNLEQTQPSTTSTLQPTMQAMRPITSSPSAKPMTFSMPVQQEATTQVQGFQPQFMGNVNPATGTFVLGQQPTYTPLSTGVLGQSSVGPQTISLNNPNYGGGYFMQQGGMVPNMQQQTMPMTQSFGGFKPQAMQRIAGSLGYQGDMSGFNDYLNNNPDKKQKMDMYNQKAMQMAQGGMVQKFQVGGTPRVLQQQYIPSQTFEEGSTLSDVMKTQAISPGLPSGAIVTPIGIGIEAGQFIDPASGQVSGSAALPTALATTTQAGMPVATPTTVMTAQTAATDVDKVAAGTQAAQTGAPVAITAEQQAESSITGLEAAQGTATLIDNPVTREIQSGELVTGAADAEKAAKFTEQVQAAEAMPSQQGSI